MQRKIQRSPLASVTADSLRAHLESEKWGTFLPAERRLCEQLGVSRPTLREAKRILVSEGWLRITQGKSTEILRSGYPQKSKRSSISTISLLTPIPLREMPTFVVCWIDELRERLGSRDQVLDLVVMPSAFRRRSNRILDEIVSERRDSAWVLFQSTEPMQHWFSRERLPCVVAGSVPPEFALSSIDLDHRAICRHAVGMLLSRGRRRPALVLPDGNAIGDLESIRGMQEGVVHHDDVPTTVIRHDGSLSMLCRMVEKAIRKDRIDSLIVARASHSLTVLTALQRLGVRFPEDLALISRDDDTFFTRTVPDVARYTSDPSRWARLLRKRVEAAIESPTSLPKTIRIMPRFHAGGSLG